MMLPGLDETIFGRRFGKTRVRACHGELERIRAKYGRLTRALVVEETKKLRHKSPLYFAFKSFSTKHAAEQYWLQVAGRLINEIQVRIVRNPDTGEPARTLPVYVHVKEPHGGSDYRPTADALSDVEIRAQILENAMRDLRSIKQKYNSLLWLSGEIDKLILLASKRQRRRRKAA